ERENAVPVNNQLPHQVHEVVQLFDLNVNQIGQRQVAGGAELLHLGQLNRAVRKTVDYNIQVSDQDRVNFHLPFAVDVLDQLTEQVDPVEQNAHYFITETQLFVADQTKCCFELMRYV